MPCEQKLLLSPSYCWKLSLRRLYSALNVTQLERHLKGNGISASTLHSHALWEEEGDRAGSRICVTSLVPKRSITYTHRDLTTEV